MKKLSILRKIEGLPAFDAVSHLKEKIDHIRLGLMIAAMIGVLAYFSVSNYKNPVTGVQYHVETEYLLPFVAICTYVPYWDVSVLDFQASLQRSHDNAFELPEYLLCQQGDPQPKNLTERLCVDSNWTRIDLYDDGSICLLINMNSQWKLQDTHDAWAIDMTLLFNLFPTDGNVYIYIGEDEDYFQNQVYVSSINNEIYVNVAKTRLISGTNVSTYYDASINSVEYHDEKTDVPCDSLHSHSKAPADSNCTITQTYIELRAPSLVVSDIILETKLALAKRIITDTSALFGTIGGLSVFLFSTVVTRFIFRTKPDTINHDTRDACLYLIADYMTKNPHCASCLSSNRSSLATTPGNDVHIDLEK